MTVGFIKATQAAEDISNSSTSLARIKVPQFSMLAQTLQHDYPAQTSSYKHFIWCRGRTAAEAGLQTCNSSLWLTAAALLALPLRMPCPLSALSSSPLPTPTDALKLFSESPADAELTPLALPFPAALALPFPPARALPCGLVEAATCTQPSLHMKQKIDQNRDHAGNL